MKSIKVVLGHTKHLKEPNSESRFQLGSQYTNVQSNLDSSNTDGSFTMANSNSFLSLYEILLIAQENKYLWNFLILS